MALGAYANQELPFEKLVAELQPQRSLRHPPLVQIMFVFHAAANAQLELPELTTRELYFDPGTSKFDVTLVATDEGDSLEVMIEYDTELFDSATIRRMLGHYQSVLEAVAADPNQRIATLPILSSSERRTIC